MDKTKKKTSKHSLSDTEAETRPTKSPSSAKNRKSLKIESNASELLEEEKKRHEEEKVKKKEKKSILMSWLTSGDNTPKSKK